MDHVDGALFSRIPSTKRDVGNNANDSVEEHYVRQSNSNAHQAGPSPADECTMRPEDLGDSDSERINANTSDNHLKNHEDKIDGKSSMDSLSSGNSISVSNSDTSGDMSDGIFGVRITCSSMELQDEEGQLQPARSSNFSVNLNSNNDTEKHGNDTIDVKFFLQNPDTEIPANNVSKSQSMPLLAQSNAQAHTISTAASVSNRILSGQSDLTIDEHDTGKADDTNGALQDSKATTAECRRWRLRIALLFPTLSLIVYVWDLASDIILAVNYRENGDISLFWITLGCIVIPHIMMAIVDVSWVWLDRDRFTAQTIGRFIIGSLTLGRIFRAVTYMRHIYYAKTLPKNVAAAAEVETNEGQTVKPKKPREWYKSRIRDEKRDCFMLDFINAFTESAPQLFVQLYLYYAYDLELTLLRVMSLLSSWISIAWTYSAYYRANREALQGVEDVTIEAFVFFFFSVLSTLAARVICTTMFLVYFKIWIGGIVLSVHFVIMLVWICAIEKPKFPGAATSCCGRYLYYMLFAHVCLLCFVNLRDGPSRVRMILFNVLIYAENVIMAILTIWKMNEAGIDNDKIDHLIVLPVGFIIHVVLLSNYYRFMHPKTGLCYNCDKRPVQCAGNS